MNYVKCVIINVLESKFIQGVNLRYLSNPVRILNTVFDECQIRDTEIWEQFGRGVLFRDNAAGRMLRCEIKYCAEHSVVITSGGSFPSTHE